MTILAALAMLQLVLLFPGHPKALVPETWLKLPLELPAIVLLVVLAGPGRIRWPALALVVALTLLLVLRLADIGSYLAFNRRFSPLLELHLLGDGWNLASTTIGPLEAALVVLLVLSILLAIAFLLYRCLNTIAHLVGPGRRVALGFAALLLAGGGTYLALAPEDARPEHIVADILPEYQARVRSVSQSIVDQRAFMASLASDPVFEHGAPAFGALAGRDVVLVFVESYGRGYVDADDFREASHARLAAADSTLQAAGLSVRSGWLTSPIRGGRSWLAHATLQSGLSVSNQARFDRLISTDRRSLTRLFAEAGWQTAGVMPAIQLAWPEGAWYGFDDTYDSAGMDYAGERFGYVTMPDQYTLSHFESAIRQPAERPLMAMIALLSTHAPWTPLPLKTDWDTIGDGRVYDGSLRFGEPISWKYRKKVQAMYRQSFDYTLDVLAGYLARYAGDGLFIIVGDHQPPPIINGWGKSGDVPIHVVSRDGALLERLPAANFGPGMLPGDALESLPMDAFRLLLSRVFDTARDRSEAIAGSPRSR